ncbi:hypothetical protein MMC17_006376 [Xylographa soralifera]|nr:hypothetical protein [Xylographa soralifera]
MPFLAWTKTLRVLPHNESLQTIAFIDRKSIPQKTPQILSPGDLEETLLIPSTPAGQLRAVMDTEELVSLTDQLNGDIDDLEDALRSLITGVLSDTAQRLPLLDRAKLYALTTYAIESIIFSSIRLSGTNAKEHPVFHELTRVKHYFDKIKVVEFGEPKRENMSLDKPAVRRFLKHDLAGNAQFDQVKGQPEAKMNTLSLTNTVLSPP